MADIYNFTKSVKTWLAHLKSARRELKYLAFLNCAVNLCIQNILLYRESCLIIGVVRRAKSICKRLDVLIIR